MRFLFAFLLLCSCSYGQSPSIYGVSNWSSYTQVRLSVQSPKNNAGYAWVIFPSYKADVESLDSGKRLIFTGPPGEYAVVLIEICDNQVAQSVRRITIEEVASTDPISKDYAKALLYAYAAGWDSAAEKLLTGASVGDSFKYGGEVITKLRDAALSKITPEFNKWLPEGIEPKNMEEREAIASKWREFAANLRKAAP